MKKRITVGFIAIIMLWSCEQTTEGNNLTANESNTPTHKINQKGNTVGKRFLTPFGFERLVQDKSSFGEYLRNLPLKPHGTEVKYYSGDTKTNNNVYDAVVDLPIGNKNLHQCADAVIRLRAEYLWNQKKYDAIHFNFTNGFRVDYTEWMKGKRIRLNGNNTTWTLAKKYSNTYADFWAYMEQVFMFAGTLSLSKELKTVAVVDMKIGDVFIKGGSPGHAIIVIDIAIDTKTQKKIYLLAQSYMPAQETQVLQNPNDENLSPWYSEDFGAELETPQWTFTDKDLKRF